MNIVDINLEELVPDPMQPRKSLSEREMRELVESLKLHGQIVPAIVVKEDERRLVVDGWRRWQACKLAGLTSLRCCLLDKHPTASELLTMQIVVNCTRSDLTLYERFEAYQRLAQLEKLTNAELATRLSVTKGTVTRVLSIGSLAPEVQALVRDGKISSVNAYALARMTASDQEAALIGISKGTSGRAELEQLARSKNSNKGPKPSRVCCELPNCSVLLRGNEPISLDGMIEVFENLIRAIRKARKDGYDVATFAQVMRVTSQKTTAKEAAPCGNG